MGRPINKRNFGDTSGGGQQISVSADVGAGAGAGVPPPAVLLAAILSNSDSTLDCTDGVDEEEDDGCP